MSKRDAWVGFITPTQQLYQKLFDELPPIDLDGHDLAELLEVIDNLGSREADVIKLRFGLRHDRMTRKAIAHEFDLSEERIRQIEANALRMLRHPKRESLIRLLFLPPSELRAQIKKQGTQIVRLLDDLRMYEDENSRLRSLYGLASGGPKLEDSIAVLDLTVRSFERLLRAGVSTIDDLYIRYREGCLMRIRGIGRKSFEEIEAKLNSINLLPKSPKN